VRIEPGADLFLEGEPADFWWVLIDGAIDLLRHIGAEDTMVGRMDVPGRWAGGFRAWDAPAGDPAEQDDIIVEIGDTGPGMPPQIASRAFDTVYTTKDTGKGTGLGLDIARRIVVERHGGLITIDSQPGSTVLRVRLPVRAHGRAAGAGR